MKGNLFCCNIQAGVFCWHGESSDRANQIVPSDTSVSDYSELVSAKDPSFTILATHTYCNDQGKPSNYFKAQNLSPTPKATPYELTSHERDSALLRYREKKKTRRYSFACYVSCISCLYIYESTLCCYQFNVAVQPNLMHLFCGAEIFEK